MCEAVFSTFVVCMQMGQVTWLHIEVVETLFWLEA